jgi:hypothetical protein
MRLLALSLFAAAALHCGGSPSTCAPASSFPSDAATSLTSAAGKLSIQVRTSPQPLARGLNTAQYTVTDATGKPVTGLTLSVVPWMPDMGHGASIEPSVTEEGNGLYVVSCLDIAMPGTWELRTAFSGPVTDNATPTFQVQ